MADALSIMNCPLHLQAKRVKDPRNQSPVPSMPPPRLPERVLRSQSGGSMSPGQMLVGSSTLRPYNSEEDDYGLRNRAHRSTSAYSSLSERRMRDFSNNSSSLYGNNSLSSLPMLADIAATSTLELGREPYVAPQALDLASRLSLLPKREFDLLVGCVDELSGKSNGGKKRAASSSTKAPPAKRRKKGSRDNGQIRAKALGEVHENLALTVKRLAALTETNVRSAVAQSRVLVAGRSQAASSATSTAISKSVSSQRSNGSMHNVDENDGSADDGEDLAELHVFNADRKLPAFVEQMKEQSLYTSAKQYRPTKKNRRSSFLHQVASDPRISFVTFVPTRALANNSVLSNSDLILKSGGRDSLNNLMRVAYGGDTILCHHFLHIREPDTGREYWRCKSPSMFHSEISYIEAKLHNQRSVERDEKFNQVVWKHVRNAEQRLGEVLI